MEMILMYVMIDMMGINDFITKIFYKHISNSTKLCTKQSNNI